MYEKVFVESKDYRIPVEEDKLKRQLPIDLTMKKTNK